MALPSESTSFYKKKKKRNKQTCVCTCFCLEKSGTLRPFSFWTVCLIQASNTSVCAAPLKLSTVSINLTPKATSIVLCKADPFPLTWMCEAAVDRASKALGSFPDLRKKVCPTGHGLGSSEMCESHGHALDLTPTLQPFLTKKLLLPRETGDMKCIKCH